MTALLQKEHLAEVQVPTALAKGFVKVTELLEKGCQDGAFPGAVLLVSQHGQVLYNYSVGRKWLKSPEGISNEMTRDTVFDLSNLTSVVVTTTLMMRFLEEGRFSLSDKVSRYVQAFGVNGKSAITIEHLLSHASALPAWHPYFEELARANSADRIGILTSRGAREYILHSINRSVIKGEPGQRQALSDLNMFLLGFLIENLSGMSLDKIATKYIFQPLGMRNSSYIDLGMMKRRGILPLLDKIAPTEECQWRRRVMCGEVQDENTWAIGGISGQAGLFSNAWDLHLFASEMIRAYRGESTFLRRETVMRFFTGPSSFDNDGEIHLGWESPNRENGMSNCGLSSHAVGQCGFTGCSLWMEPAQGVSITLMSNRVHPSRSSKQIRSFRPQLHSAILEALHS